MRSTNRPRHVLPSCVVVVGVLLGLVACGGDPTEPEPPPVLSIVATGGVSTLSSGNTLQLTAQLTSATGAVLPLPAVTWTSNGPSIAEVSATGLVTGAVAGATAIRAAIANASASISVTVTPGVPARLAIRTQPANASSGVPLGQQPVIEVRDARENVTTQAVVTVTVAVASGGGALSGTTTASTALGVATFSGLALTGIIGARTLVFTASGLADVTSGAVVLGPGAPARLVIRTQPAGAASGAAFATQPAIEVRDAEENMATSAVIAVTASLQSGGGTLGGVLTASTVQGVATFSSLALSGVIGTRILSFSAPALAPTASDAFALQSGAPAALTLTTTPAGGGLNSTYSTQPVVELRDGAGNLSTGPGFVVTASITAGNGTLTGATAGAVNGIASFSGFGISGTNGSRTLSFAVPGAPAVTFTTLPCDRLLAPRLTLTPTSATLTGVAIGPVVTSEPPITDPVASCTAMSGLTPSVAYTSAATGWLSAVVATSPSRLSLRADPATLVSGTHRATVTVASANAGTATFAVVFEVRPAFIVRYGLETEKVRQLAIDSTLRVIPVIRDETGAIVTPPVQFVSRSPSIASVIADGTITARVGGHAWIVAQTVGPPVATDSLYVNVPATAGPLLRADITRFTYARNVAFSVTLVLDTRGATIGAAELLFTWPTNFSTPAMLRLDNVVAGTVGAPVITSDAGSGTTRIAIASAAGMSGVITLGRFDFTPIGLGESLFVLRFNQLIGLGQQSLLDLASSLRYPVVVR